MRRRSLWTVLGPTLVVVCAAVIGAHGCGAAPITCPPANEKMSGYNVTDSGAIPLCCPPASAQAMGCFCYISYDGGC